MKRVYIFSIWMQATFTDKQWFKIYQHMDFLWKETEDFTPEKIDKIVKKDIATRKSQQAAIFSRENENREGGGN